MITPGILWTAHAFECAQGHHINIQGEHDGKQEHNTREPLIHNYLFNSIHQPRSSLLNIKNLPVLLDGWPNDRYLC